jgi:spore maturation protein CgeB
MCVAYNPAPRQVPHAAPQGRDYAMLKTMGADQSRGTTPDQLGERTSPAVERRPRPRVFLVGSQLSFDGFEWHILDSLKYLNWPAQFFATEMAPRWPSTIRRLAHKVSHFALREPERLFESSLIGAVRRFEPTLILVTLGNSLSPKTVRQLRAISKAPIVCWCQDQLTTIGRQYLLGAEYDAVFVKDRYMQDLFTRMIKSTAFHYLPEACNPRLHRSVELSPRDQQSYACDVMIAGTLYYYRQEILRALADFNLKAFGSRPDWLIYRLSGAYPGREVVGDDKARAARAARICLNTLHYGEVDGLNARAFEIAGCGGFQLITQTPVLQEHFRVGEELVDFQDIDDLVDKVRHYLKNPEEAARIARNGQQRAHQEHTYEHRLRSILTQCLGYATFP